MTSREKLIIELKTMQKDVESPWFPLLPLDDSYPAKKVKEIITANNNPADFQLDKPSGVYFLNVTTALGQYSEKISVTH